MREGEETWGSRRKGREMEGLWVKERNVRDGGGGSFGREEE